MLSPFILRFLTKRRVQLVGVVEDYSWVRSAVMLRLDDGSGLRCKPANGDRARFKDFVGKRVRITATAVYRPSGAVLHLAVEQWREAAERDARAGVEDWGYTAAPPPAWSAAAGPR